MAIDSDIADFRNGCFDVSKAWSVTGKFEKSDIPKLWVYAHTGYVKNSAAVFGNFKKCVDIEHTPPCTRNCTSSHCNILLPFFCDNKTLKQSWCDLGMEDLAKECDDAMRKNPGLEEGIFASQGCSNASGFEFHENTWTKRLVGSLNRHLPNHDVKYTAESSMHFATYQSPLSNLGTDHGVVQCYPFHGATDFAISNKIQVQVEVSNNEASPHSPPQSSGDEVEIELGKQADPMQKYPNKIGELTAAIINSIIQKCCRMFKKNKPIKNELIGSGAYITKCGAPFIVKYKMPIVYVEDRCPNPIPCAKLFVSESRVCSVTPQTLCSAITQLVGTTSCSYATPAP